MLANVCAVIDHERPGHYVIMVLDFMTPDTIVGEKMSWREARVRMEPEGYAHLASTTFSHWCKENGW